MNEKSCLDLWPTASWPEPEEMNPIFPKTDDRWRIAQQGITPQYLSIPCVLLVRMRFRRQLDTWHSTDWQMRLTQSMSQRIVLPSREEDTMPCRATQPTWKCWTISCGKKTFGIRKWGKAQFLWLTYLSGSVAGTELNTSLHEWAGTEKKSSLTREPHLWEQSGDGVQLVVRPSWSLPDSKAPRYS